VSARRSPTVRRRRLGIELRALRDHASLTIEEVANSLECSASKVSRIETGHVRSTPRDVRDMLAMYDVDGDRAEQLIQLARDTRQTGWWEDFGDPAVRIAQLVGLETEAAEICEFQVLLVPGLLQTANYARAIFNALAPELDDDEVEQRVRFRLARQELLGQQQPPGLEVVLDEAVLRRPVGGTDVMREQVAYLVERAAQPNISVRVLPFDQGAHAWMTGSFTILRFEEALNLDVVYIEAEERDLYLDEPKRIALYIESFRLLRKNAIEIADYLGPPKEPAVVR
jgi:transcriptional regulator with XRE-family HTH domain